MTPTDRPACPTRGLATPLRAAWWVAIAAALPAVVAPAVCLGQDSAAPSGRSPASPRARAEPPSDPDDPVRASSPVRRAAPVRRVEGHAAAGPLHAPFEEVDAGRDDTGGIATSLRRLPLDLRLPAGFDRVYRVPGREDLYMRANGALYAVFPKSEYRASGRGVVPVTPTDVVYRIGLAPAAPRGPPPAPRAARVDRRVVARIATATLPAVGRGAERPDEAAPAAAGPSTRRGDDRPGVDADPWGHLALGRPRVVRE